MARDKLGKELLMNDGTATLERFDFEGIVIDTDNFVSDLGKACCRHQSNIARTDDRDAHYGSTLRVLRHWLVLGVLLRQFMPPLPVPRSSAAVDLECH